MSDASTWGDREGPAEQALQEFVEDRRKDADLINAHSLSELEFWDKEWERLDRSEQGDTSRWLEERVEARQMVARTRHRAFSALISWERQLSYSNTNERIFQRFQTDVDQLLALGAPDLIDMFNSVYRRLREAVEHEEDAPLEELSQATASCRRILKVVADHVYPVPGAPVHGMDDASYRNRLREFVREATESETFRSVLSSGIDSVYERFVAVDKLASKGVHAKVASGKLSCARFRPT